MLLDRLLAEPGWAEIYERWRRAAERQAIVEVVRRLVLPVGTDLRPEAVRALAAAQMPGGDTPGARSAMRPLDGYLQAHLCELFARAGVPLAYRGGRGSPLDLRPAFRTTLRWYLWLALRRWLELRHRHPALRGGVSATRRRAAAQYEVAAPQIAARFRRLVASLAAHPLFRRLRARPRPTVSRRRPWRCSPARQTGPYCSGRTQAVVAPPPFRRASGNKAGRDPAFQPPR